MPTFDRFDICEAHYALEVDWHNGGWLQERPSNRRRKEATHVQLARMDFAPSHGVREYGYDGLTENGKAIYRELETRYGFVPDHAYLQHGAGTNGPFRTERVALRHEHADRYLVRFEGKWRRVHVQVRRTYIVYRGEKITVQVSGL